MDVNILIIYILLGLPLLIQYYNIEKSNKLLTNNGSNLLKKYKNMKNIYLCSILISAIAGLYLLNYFMNEIEYKNEEYHSMIYASLIILIGYSLLWIPTLYTKINKFVLFCVSIGPLLMIITLILNGLDRDIDKIALFMSIYLFFHTFFLDFLVW